MSRFSDEFLHELNTADITRLLDWRNIKVKGGNLVEKQIPCVSPAHDDHNPSMSVNIKTGQFHCHGCGVSGTGCISMYAAMTGQDASLDFRDIVESLSDVLGMTPAYKNVNDQAYKKAQTLKEVLFGVVQQSMKTPYFADDRQKVADFCTTRAMTNADREAAKIGFIPRNFPQSPFAKEHAELLMEAGILKVSEKGNVYSPFGGRITFPITNDKGEIIALAGRRIGDESGPKYINSDETSIFHKSQVLYGLYSALKGLGPGEKLDRLIVTEGYMDTISAKTRGFPETVATMGTAATEKHFKLMARKANSIIFVFDPDDAGKRAGERALINALPYAGSMDIRFAEMPDDGDVKLDPDEMLKKHGPEAFSAVIDQALPMAAYAAQFIVGREPKSNLMELLKSGMEDRGKSVFDSMPPGLTRQAMSMEISRLIGSNLGLAIFPEHIGMSIDYDQKIKEVMDENAQLAAENDQLKRQLERLQANQRRPMTIDDARLGTTATAATAAAIQHAMPERQKIDLTNDASQVESTKPNVAPFTMAFISDQKPVIDQWVMISDGRFGVVEAINNEQHRIRFNNGESITTGLSGCVALNPQKVIVSKHNGHFHNAGDRILQTGTGWFGGWPESHFHTAKALLNCDGKPSRLLLESAATLALTVDEVSKGALQQSLLTIRSMSDDELLKKIGADPASRAKSAGVKAEITGEAKSANGSQSDRLPPGFLINAQPKARDFVTSAALGGKILVVDEGIDGGLLLKNPQDNTRHQLQEFGKLLVLKTEGKTLSKVDSPLAKIGQPIFKITKEGSWQSAVPEQWVKEKLDQLAKQPAPSESFSP